MSSVREGKSKLYKIMIETISSYGTLQNSQILNQFICSLKTWSRRDNLGLFKSQENLV